MTEFGTSILVGHHTPAIEARVTAPDEPSVSSSGVREANLSAAYYQLGYGDVWGDARSETPDGALTFSAVWACVRCIAQTIASVSWHTYERGPAGRTRQEIEDDVSWLLGMQANPETTALEWRQVTIKDALTWGNGYSEIERTNGGRPVWKWRLDPDRVSPDRTSRGQLVYEVENGSGVKNTVMMPDAMYHLKGLGPDGLVGWSVVKMAATSIKLGKQTEKYGSDTFGRGIMPSGLLKIPGNVNDVQRKEYRRSFQEAYAGQRNSHGIIVLGGGAEFTPFTLPNDDMQFLSTRQFQVSDIARWYGVPPHKIGDLSRSTNNNIEEQGREFVTDCLGPWAARLETEANVKLYGRTSRGRRYTKLDLEPIQRGNSQTQAIVATTKVNGGVWTPNEARAYLGDNPLPDADVLLVQGAMTTLARVVNPPEPPAPPAPPAPEPPPKKDDSGSPPAKSAQNKAELRRVFGALLADAYGRLYRTDADKARRADNKGRLAEHVAEWYAMPASTARVAEILRPIIEAACIAAGVPADLIGPRAGSAALAHVAGCRDGLLRHGVAAAAGWSAEAAAGAETLRLFDPDQERDEDGRFAEGGGGGEGDKGDSGKGGEGHDPEQEKEDHREQEDTAREEAREAEDEQIQEARDKEDEEDNARSEKTEEDLDEKHEQEEKQVEAAREAEDGAIQESREKEDAAESDRRDAEDAQVADDREKQDEALGQARDAEDKAALAEDAGREAQREKEDAATQDKRDAEDQAIEDRFDNDEDYTHEQRIADHEANDEAREKEDAATQKAREKEDAAAEKGYDARDATREKEDAAIEKAREKEDGGREKDRDRKDAAIEKAREKEDDARDKERDKEDEKRGERQAREDEAMREAWKREDAATEKKRGKEDKEREARRKGEDKEVAEKRKQEDKGAKALEKVGAAR